jgi:type IV secretion system protein VirB10
MYMENNFNEQFEAWKNNGEIEQVTNDMFEFTPLPEETHDEPDNEPVNEPDNIDNAGNVPKKVSFAELREGKKVPRLKKSMVLAILTGGVFVFLMVVNLIIQKRENQKKYFDEQRNKVEIGNDFSLGDLENRRRQNDDEIAENTENDEFYFQSPPSYTPLPVNKPASPPPVYRSSGASYSDTDLLAIRARIGKEGGYGITTRNPGTNSIEPLMANPAGYLSDQAWMAGQIPSPEEYTRQRLEDIARLTRTSGGVPDRDNTRYTEAGKYNPDNPPRSSNSNYLNDDCLFPGTIIHAILVSRIDTDYPGPIHARVTENVYDSMTGKNLLIPQGTILQGNYSSSSIGVSKVQIAWESMVISYDGIAYQVSLGGMAGVDKRGRAGISGTLDDHYFEWLKAAGIISLFSIFNSEIMYQTQGNTSPQIRELMDINQGIVSKIGDRLIERALDIQPTVRVANGTPVSVSVNTIVYLKPFPAIRAEEKWVRR